MTVVQSVITDLTKPMREIMAGPGPGGRACPPGLLPLLHTGRLRAAGGVNRRQCMEALRRRGLLEPCPPDQGRWPWFGRTTDDLGEQVVAELRRRQEARAHV